MPFALSNRAAGDGRAVRKERMEQVLASVSKNNDVLQQVTTPPGVAGQGAPTPSLLEQFSLILDKIAHQLSSSSEFLAVAGDIKPAELAAPKPEQPSVPVEAEPESEPESEHAQGVPVDTTQSEEEDVVQVGDEQQASSEVEPSSQDGSQPETPVEVQPEASVETEGSETTATEHVTEVVQDPLVVATTSTTERVTKTAEPKGVEQAELLPSDSGSEAKPDPEVHELMSRLLREQSARGRESVNVGKEDAPKTDSTLQVKTEDPILKQFLISSGIIKAEREPSEDFKALEHGVRALFERNADATLKTTSESSLPTGNTPVSSVFTRPTFDFSTLGKGIEVKSALSAIQPSSTGNEGDAAKLADARNTSTRESRAERKERPLSQRAELRTLEKVERALKEIARSKDGKTISLRLDPPSLGSVRIDVSLRDGALHARIAAESLPVSQLLREKAHEIQRNLRELGLEVDQVSVSVRDENGDFSQFTQGQSFQNFLGQEDGIDLGGSDWQEAEPTGVRKQEVVAEDHWIA